jgi:hypothetical protein
MSQILWYGERGIINAFVTEMNRRGGAGAKAFLEEIKWADGGQPGWIRDVESVTYLVEIGLSEFGNPDLILVCRRSRRRPIFRVLCPTKKAWSRRNSTAVSMGNSL